MRRRCVSLVAIFCLCAAQGLSLSPVGGQEPQEKQLSKEELKKKLRKIQVGKDTTFIEGPLDAEGNVDFLAAMNARLSEGVTPENNAVVELWMAAGPDFYSLETVGSREFFGEIGIRRFPSYDPFLVDWQDFALPPPAKELTDEESDAEMAYAEENSQYYELERRLLEASARPWTDEEFPQLAKWLERNEKPLKHIEKAVERERFYEPMSWSLTSLEYELYEVAEPTVEAALTASNLLAVRAMHRLGSGDLQGAAEDAYRLHRLAALVCLSPTSYAWQCGSDIRATACGASRALADCPEAASALLLAHLAKLGDMPKDKYLVERYDFFERLICLAIMEHTIRSALKDADNEVRSSNRDLAKALDAAFGNHFMDWSEPLRIGNRFFDQTAAALRKPTVKETHEALGKVTDDYYEFVGEDEEEQPNLLLRIFQQKSIGKALGRDVAKTLLDGYFYPADEYYDFYQQDRKLLDMTKIALAIAAYQRDNGTYPLSIATLTPRYLPLIPIDADNGRPYQIRLSVVSLGIDGQDDDVSQGYDDMDVRLRELPAK
ncbi:hypothetical protein LOC68_20870 [Blastopirellula sp. JC732]|uniref:Uncharacterized protein n=1 Tax=Blastopirellula sediminis TaxID=2894196 RepID=A0A9X1SI48_9BACT|nr:hypothetical protein [Blastopirellula sediminis]MCC9605849.1 hypothetical protein [Blastopirellula sediminis]MCC9630852.1 hypothetical protein [Blastopirellula sediminis]